MGWEAWVTLAVVGLMLAALVRNLGSPDVLLLGALAVLMAVGGVCQSLGWSERFPGGAAVVSGFGNEGLITVAMLFVVVGGLTQTGAIGVVARPLLGRPRSVARAQLRLMLPVAGLSAFLNNTPIVAVFLPVVREWCRKTGISPSKLMMPLSFATILGGLCTLIGTSTNLVVHGLYMAQQERMVEQGERARAEGLGMFDLAWVGLPALGAGLVYMLVFSRWLLPERQPAVSIGDDPRRYTVEMMVEPGGPLVGRSIEQAGLRHLPGMFLVEIDREGEVLAAVGPGEKLRANDRLVFAGVVESVVDLRRLRGLVPATDQVFKLESPVTQRGMVEAVVSNTCPLVGKTIREGRFRSVYDAAVIAVGRNSERINRKIGDIVLQPGDTLLLETHPRFAQRQRHSRDFFLVSRVEGAAPPRHERAWIAFAILGLMVLAMGLDLLSPVVASTLAAGLMVASGCVSGTEARQSVEWSVLLVIGASLGLSKVVFETGAASGVAGALVGLVGDNPWAMLAAVYAATMLFTELLTNNAAAALVFPIGYALAVGAGLNPMPFVVAVAVASSCGFATPLGYQTHLMVYGPGGYRFTDFLRFGLPLNAIVMAVTVTVAPIVWPF